MQQPQFSQRRGSGRAIGCLNSELHGHCAGAGSCRLAQVGQGEGVVAVAAVGRPEHRKQRRVFGHRQHPAVAARREAGAARRRRA